MLVYKGKTKLFDHSYNKELSYIIKNSYDENKKISQETNISYKLEKFLTQHKVLEILDIINCIFSTIVTIFYILSTYTHPEDTTLDKRMNKFMNVIETFIILYFILHYLLRLFCSQNRIITFFEILNLLDIIIIVSLILTKLKFVKSSEIEYYLRCIKIFRILMLFKLENILQKRANEQVSFLYEVAIMLISIIFISNAILLEVENNHIRDSEDYVSEDQLYKFHDVFYFELVTLSTVGLGDITPQTDLGRLIVLITIITTIAVIPIIPSKISTVFSLNSKYSRMKYMKNSKTPNHLVLIGNCGPESFEACLEELYHEDHANIDFDTVIMQKKPDERMLKIFEKKSYFNQIYYLVGDVLTHQDLERAKINNSICSIVLANKVTSNHKKEDFYNIMKALSIVKYSKIVPNKNNTRVLLQLMLPEAKEIYYNSLLQNNSDNDQNIQIICLEEIKLQLLGKSCQCPGINTIIAMLITSKKPDIQIKDIYKLDPWMKEYLTGLENEIYCIKIKCELLFNLNFNDLVKIIFELTGFIIIGTDVIHQELKMYRSMESMDWDGILKTMNEAKAPTRFMWMMNNLALFRLDRQGDEMYHYRYGNKLNVAPFEVRMLQIGGKLLYLNYGQSNFCHRWCIEAGVEFGWRIEYLKSIVTSLLMNGETEAAQKYLHILHHTKYYKIWMPEGIDTMKRLMSEDDQLTSDNMLAEAFLLNHFANRDSQDPVTQEASLMFALQSCNKEVFKKRLQHAIVLQPQRHVPLHCQEALCVYNLSDSFNVDNAIKKNYEAFMSSASQLRGMDMQQAKATMYERFGNTFFYDYYFNNYQQPQ